MSSDRPGAAGRAPDGRRLRWAEHRSQRRAAFVAAGVSAVDRYGAEANAEQIAEVAGVSRTVLYRYFRDRDDLRQAIADQVVTSIVASVVPHLKIGPAATARHVIAGVIEVILGWLDEHPNLYYFLRNRRSLEAVEQTLADRVAALLQGFLLHFGIDSEQAEPSAYGMVGLVESTGAWWLARRSVSRDRLAELLCAGVWNLLEGTARTNGIVVGLDDPLPRLPPVEPAPPDAATTAAAALPGGDQDGYDGPAELAAGARTVAVTVTLRGRFEPITGSYAWYGRVAPSPEVAALVAAGERQVTLRTPFAAVATTLTEVDPWGRPRVSGVGTAPFPVLDTLPDDEQ